MLNTKVFLSFSKQIENYLPADTSSEILYFHSNKDIMQQPTTEVCHCVKDIHVMPPSITFTLQRPARIVRA